MAGEKKDEKKPKIPRGKGLMTLGVKGKSDRVKSCPVR